ncbi:hypothetical protein [Streptomyces sp. NPDC051662]
MSPLTGQGPAAQPAPGDRLTFNGAIIETGTESYSLAQTKAKQLRG